MTDKQLKLIYDYMGWEESVNDHPYPWGNAKELDSNHAWECVQEMERRGEIISFSDFVWYEYLTNITTSLFPFWLMNPHKLL